MVNIWLIPHRWNQAGFDVVHIVGKGYIRFIQISVADSHKMKERYYVMMLDQLDAVGIIIDCVEIAFVIPSEKNPDKFKISEVMGSFGKYKNNIVSPNMFVTSEIFLYGFQRTKMSKHFAK